MEDRKLLLIFLTSIGLSLPYFIWVCLTIQSMTFTNPDDIFMQYLFSGFIYFPMLIITGLIFAVSFYLYICGGKLEF